MSQGLACRRMPWGTWAALGTLFHSQAFAEQVSPSGMAGSYEVASGCPAEAAWRDALRARLPEDVRTPGVLNDFTVKIRRVASEGGFQYSGELGQSSEPGLAPRSVRGVSCQEVVEALTLIAALGGQPAASSAEAREVARDEWSLTPEQEWALTREVDAPPEPEPLPYREGLRVGAVGFALFHSVAAPQLATDLGLGLSMSWDTESWQPWVMLGVYEGGEVSPVQGTAARARFERWSTHLVACPLRFPRRSSAAVRPCLDLDVGRLTGTGLGANSAAQPSALTASAGLGARFEWSIWERIELGAMLGGVLPLARPRFYFEPDVTAFEVSALGLRAGMSASLLF